MQHFYSVEWKGSADKFVTFNVHFGHKILTTQRWMHKIAFDASVYDFLSAAAKVVAQRTIWRICTYNDLKWKAVGREANVGEIVIDSLQSVQSWKLEDQEIKFLVIFWFIRFETLRNGGDIDYFQ